MKWTDTESVLKEIERRRDIIISEPNGHVRESMISDLLIGLYYDAPAHSRLSLPPESHSEDLGKGGAGEVKSVPFKDIVIIIREMDNGNGVVDCDDLINAFENLTYKEDIGRDELFLDAAKLIVSYQTGSTSLLQRKMKLGYNRACQIMNQMYEAGIVGELLGSVPRKCLLGSIGELEKHLRITPEQSDLGKVFDENFDLQDNVGGRAMSRSKFVSVVQSLINKK